MQNATYLIHFGIKDMKWHLRRYQNYDGSLTPEGRERYGVGEARRGPSVKSHQQAPAYRAGRPVKSIWVSKKEGYLNGDQNDKVEKEITKPKHVKDFWSTKVSDVPEEVDLSVVKGPHVKDFWSTKTSDIPENASDAESNAKKRPSVKDFWSKKESKEASDEKSEEKKELKNSKEDVKAKKTAGKDAVKGMSDKEFNRFVSKMTDDELQAFLTRTNKENQARKNIQTTDDAKKKQFENTQATLGDARSIANDASNLARNMKNLTSNKSTKSYIDPKKLGKMSDDEIRAATNRAIIENNYLSATNQTVQKGKSSIDWDKIATIAGIAATTISIAGSVNAIRNRRND